MNTVVVGFGTVYVYFIYRNLHFLSNNKSSSSQAWVTFACFAPTLLDYLDFQYFACERVLVKVIPETHSLH